MALDTPRNHPARRNLAISAGLVLITLAAYWQTPWLGFISLDDPAYVSHNAQVAKGLTQDSIRWAFSFHPQGYWHPLTWLSLMFDREWFGSGPRGFHLVNLALHVANTLLLFWILVRMTRAAWPSALAAALFALHPLHVEPVAWIASRKDVLSTLLALAATAAYVAYVRRPGWARYALVSCVFLLGLLAKPMLVTWPLALLLLDYWPLGRMKPPARPATRQPPTSPWRTIGWLVLEKLPLLALSILFVAITFFSQRGEGSVVSLQEVSLATRLQYAVTGYVFYLEKAFWPAGLAVFYPHDAAPATGEFLVSLAVLVVVTAGVAWGTRRGRAYLAVGWLWFLITFLPVIGLVPLGIQLRADRFTYIPLIGFCLVVAWGAADLAERWRFYRTATALAAALLLAFAILTARQLGCWINTGTVFEQALLVTEDNDLACVHLAAYLMENSQSPQAEADFERARKYCDKVLHIHPNDPDALQLRIQILVHDHRYDDAARTAEEILRQHPESGAVHNALGSILIIQGKTPDAVKHLLVACRIEPENTTILSNLHKVALVAFDERKWDLAAACWGELLRLLPDDWAAMDGLANVRTQQGRFQAAEDLLRASLVLHPAEPHARTDLGNVLAKQGKYPEAIQQWSAVLREQPQDPVTLCSLAWTLATCPDTWIRDGQKAVSLAEQADDLLHHSQPEILDTLAAAYAEAGRFPAAVKTAEEALTLAKRQGKETLETDLRARLKLYRRNRPFRDTPQGPGN